MSDTPETDAVIKNVGDGPYIAYLVHFARKLERERDEARRERSEAQDGWSRALDERDEARRLASVWEKLALREASINGAKICAKEEA